MSLGFDALILVAEPRAGTAMMYNHVGGTRVLGRKQGSDLHGLGLSLSTMVERGHLKLRFSKLMQVILKAKH